MRTTIVFLLAFALPITLLGQQRAAELDSLKREIVELQLDVENINLNLEKSREKFKTGLLIATLGYSVTIAGGLMLGRENDELGQVILVAGGATGVVGTYMLLDAFKYLGLTRRR